MTSSSASLTPEELKEVQQLQVENEVLAQEVSQLISTMMTEKERRKELAQQEKDVDSHPSRAHLKEIAGMQKDAPILALIKQWRSARQQCSAYSETLEEVRANFVEMKALYEELTANKQKKKETVC